MSKIEERLEKLGIELPDAPAPAANYVPYVLSRSELFISGQLPMTGGVIVHSGHLGYDVDVAEGQAAAQLCAINILAQAKAALGCLGQIERCIKLGGFVSCTSRFTDHPAVINGASDLMVEVLGEAGRHSRFAVGVESLPFGATVEIEALFHVTA